MVSNDTKYTSLNDTLSAAGKSVFVRFYYDFKDTSVSQELLAEKLFLENPATTSKNKVLGFHEQGIFLKRGNK